MRRRRSGGGGCGGGCGTRAGIEIINIRMSLWNHLCLRCNAYGIMCDNTHLVPRLRAPINLIRIEFPWQFSSASRRGRGEVKSSINIQRKRVGGLLSGKNGPLRAFPALMLPSQSANEIVSKSARARAAKRSVECLRTRTGGRALTAAHSLVDSMRRCGAVLTICCALARRRRYMLGAFAYPKPDYADVMRNIIDVSRMRDTRRNAPAGIYSNCVCVCVFFFAGCVECWKT